MGRCVCEGDKSRETIVGDTPLGEKEYILIALNKRSSSCLNDASHFLEPQEYKTGLSLTEPYINYNHKNPKQLEQIVINRAIGFIHSHNHKTIDVFVTTKSLAKKFYKLKQTQFPNIGAIFIVKCSNKEISFIKYPQQESKQIVKKPSKGLKGFIKKILKR